VKPYYQEDGITIYHGDNKDILPQLEPVELVLTDPPWMARPDKITRKSKGVAGVINPSKGIGYGTIGHFDLDVISLAFQKTTADILVICGYRELGQVISALEPIRGVFIWHKPNGGISVAYPAPLDTAYIVWGAHKSKITGHMHWNSGVFSIPVPTAGCISNGERILTEENGPAAHPCQGPVELYKQLLKAGNGPVLDPYMGSGTTLRAAKDLGRKCIGIEIEERYCEMAVKRLAQEVLPL
jgi:site-specific DNA-methyltransferase (adenine-specific)